MLVKGIIQSIDLTTNRCIVRIPTFETAGTKTIFTADATISILPGVYNGYKQNDVVVVGFGTGGPGDAVILGKLYLGVKIEKTNIGGAIHCSDLVVDNSATLPANIALNFEDTGGVTNSEVVPLSSYKTIKDIAVATSNNTAAINKLNNKKESFSSAEDTIVGTWTDDKNVWRRLVTVNTMTTILPNISAETAWIDLSGSYIQGVDTTVTPNETYVKAITDYKIAIKQDSTIEVTITNLDELLLEEATITVKYIKPEAEEQINLLKI